MSILQKTVLQLFRKEFPEVAPEILTRIATIWKDDAKYQTALKEIEEIEIGLGPVGIWCSKYENHQWTFWYPLHYDHIYRELKYIYLPFFTGSPLRVTVTRDIVHYSVSHVENCLKLFCSRKGLGKFENKPLGAIVTSLNRLLKIDFVDSLRMLASIWNPAKHEYGLFKDEMMFSVENAIMIYLVSRKLGFMLLELAGELPAIQKACKDGPFLTPNLYI